MFTISPSLSKFHPATVQDAIKWFKELEKEMEVHIKVGVKFVIDLLKILSERNS